MTYRLRTNTNKKNDTILQNQLDKCMIYLIFADQNHLSQAFSVLSTARKFVS